MERRDYLLEGAHNWSWMTMKYAFAIQPICKFPLKFRRYTRGCLNFIGGRIRSSTFSIKFRLTFRTRCLQIYLYGPKDSALVSLFSSSRLNIVIKINLRFLFWKNIIFYSYVDQKWLNEINERWLSSPCQVPPDGLNRIFLLLIHATSHNSLHNQFILLCPYS